MLESVDLLLTTLVQDHTTQKLVGLNRTISQKIASFLESFLSQMKKVFTLREKMEA